MTVTGSTKVLAILGHPIGHSLSPLMQNAALEVLGLPFVFIPFAVSPDDLPTAIAGLKSLGVAGFNVTVPHKKSVVPLLDEIDPSARMIGAVNTVKNDNGRFIGYNTDAPGFLQSLREELSFQPQGASVLIIGAGGAARAALHALAAAGIKSVTVANRAEMRARVFCGNFKDSFPNVDMESSDLSLLANEASLSSFDLLVNTTSVGLDGSAFTHFAPASSLVAYDMVYGVKPTPFVQAIRNAGGSAVNGYGMLAAQGEKAFHIWTGVAPPAGLMKKILMEAVCAA